MQAFGSFIPYNKECMAKVGEFGELSCTTIGCSENSFALR